MKFSTPIILFIIALMVFTSCNNNRPDHLKIRIIETTDVHGALFPVDFLNNNQPISSLANVYTFVEKQRNINRHELILLDNGDILQGDPSVYYSNFMDTNSRHICSRIYNFFDYDAVCIGNHDIEPGHSVYDKLVSEMDMPMLGANAVRNNNGKPYFQPYHIIERQGVRIAVLGLTTPAIPTWLPENIWEGMHFEDMIESAKKWVDTIQRKENPDVLIGLFHSGVDYTYNGQDENTWKNENASQLVAERVPGFDVIFVGHDHTGWNKTILNSKSEEVLILGATSRARDVAVADIELFYDAATDSYEKEITGLIVGVGDQQPHKKYLEHFGEFKENIDEYINRPVGTFATAIDSRPAILGPAPFTDIIHQVQLDLTGADISFTSPLSFNTTIEKGDIYVKDLFKLYRFENLLYTMKLTGNEIKNILEYSYGLWYATVYSDEDHLIRYKRDNVGNIIMSANNSRALTAGQYFNYASAAGIHYTVDITKPEGQRITILKMSSGEPFDMQKIYTVAMNSYRGNGGGGHLTKGAGIGQEIIPARIADATEKDLRFYLYEYIQKNSPVNPPAYNNWKVIPEALAEKCRQNDIQLLFGNDYYHN